MQDLNRNRSSSLRGIDFDLAHETEQLISILCKLNYALDSSVCVSISLIVITVRANVRERKDRDFRSTHVHRIVRYVEPKYQMLARVHARHGKLPRAFVLISTSYWKWPYDL